MSIRILAAALLLTSPAFAQADPTYRQKIEQMEAQQLAAQAAQAACQAAKDAGTALPAGCQ